MERIREIAGLLAGMNDPDEVERFLVAILTPKEVQELAGRWEVVRLLHQGHSQRRIAGLLGMSLCKITRGSRELKRPNSILKQVFDRLQPRRETAESP